MIIVQCLDIDDQGTISYFRWSVYKFYSWCSLFRAPWTTLRTSALDLPYSSTGSIQNQDHLVKSIIPIQTIIIIFHNVKPFLCLEKLIQVVGRSSCAWCICEPTSKLFKLSWCSAGFNWFHWHLNSWAPYPHFSGSVFAAVLPFVLTKWYSSLEYPGDPLAELGRGYAVPGAWHWAVASAI